MWKSRSGRRDSQPQSGMPVFPHGVGHVGQRREAAIAEVRGVVVYQLVEQPHREVGHADFVGVGKAEGHARLRRVPVLLARVVLTRQVLGGFSDVVEQVLNLNDGRSGKLNCHTSILPYTSTRFDKLIGNSAAGI